ncbi:MAG: CRISPR-associated protein Cas5 [Candidatus Sericytochromatia bacterium]
MLCLYLQAPFAVFRNLTAGSFRPTANFITPSAAYGLLLNLAGHEMRYDDHKSVMTLIKSGLPAVRLAVGALSFPEEHNLFQQLHNYPVGKTRIEHAPMTKGSKYNIAPARRAFLSNIKAYLCVDGNEKLEQEILDGLEGKRPRAYGIPFLGDNNFLPDKIEPVAVRQAAHWYEVLDAQTGVTSVQERVTRMTITIDRADMSKTRSQLFVPQKKAQLEIPTHAWVEVAY